MSGIIVNDIIVSDFCGYAAYVIHPSNPLHLIIHFALFGNDAVFSFQNRRMITKYL